MNYDFDLDNYEYQQNASLCDASELYTLVESVSNYDYDLGNTEVYTYDYQN